MSPIHSFLVGICFLFVIFCVHLLVSTKDKRHLTKFLSVVILSRIGQILLLLSINHKLELFPILYKVVTASNYLAPCCLYLYVKFFLNSNKNFKPKDYLHFMPFGIAVIHYLTTDTIYPVNWDTIANLIKSSKYIFITERTGVFSANFMASLRISLMISYLILSWNQLLKSNVFKAKKWTSNKIWIIFIVSAATIFQSIGLSALFINYGPSTFPWFLAINCFLLTFLVLFLLHKPEILYGYLLINTNNTIKENASKSKKENDASQANVAKTDSDYGQNTLIRIQLENAMDSKKLFLDPNLQILDLANLLNLPVHQCSAIINNIIGKNFRDWCNSFRVQYFIELYPSKKDLMTIESMANDSGFKSLTTFYNAFKKETGMMPKQYFKNTTIKGS